MHHSVRDSPGIAMGGGGGGLSTLGEVIWTVGSRGLVGVSGKARGLNLRAFLYNYGVFIGS